MFFKKKSKREDFYEAIREKNWRKVVKLGKKAFKDLGSKIPLDVTVSTAKAYLMLNRKREAINFLLEVAKEKESKGLIDEAEYLFQKVFEIEQNANTVESLINFYVTRGNKDKIVEILTQLINKVEEKWDDNLIRIIEENSKKINEGNIFANLAVLYEKRNKDKAYYFWIRTAEVFEQKGLDEYAFRSLVRAKRVKNTPEINRRIIDYIAVKSKKFPVQVLIQILLENKNPDFWIWVFEEFRKKGKIEIFKGIIENEEIDRLTKLFFTVLLLADIKNTFPEDILDEINQKDPDIYHYLINYLEENYGTKLIKGVFGSATISIDDIINYVPNGNETAKTESVPTSIEIDIDDLFK